MTTTPATLDQILRDPSWLAHRYDPIQDAWQFVRIDRATRRNATFLTDDYLPASMPLSVFDRRTLAGRPLPPAAPLHFIFHSAFCCSTLLANAFDREGAATALKEPVVLNDIVGFMQRGGDRQVVATVLEQAMTLLARPFVPGEAVVLKPSNIVNGLAIAMMAARPTANAVLVHAPLEVFLGSIAKKGMWGRLWVRTLFLGLAKDGLLPFGYSQEEYLGQTDLQIAALCWLAQQALFARMSDRFGDRVRTLNSDRVMDRADSVVSAMATSFGLPIDAQAVGEIVAGRAFTQHSKDQKPFDGDARRAEIAAAHADHADEIGKVSAWAGAVAAAAGIATVLPNALLA